MKRQAIDQEEGVEASKERAILPLKKPLIWKTGSL